MEISVLPWNDFLIESASVNDKVNASGLFESEWEWLKQLCKLAGEDCCSEVSASFEEVTLSLRLYRFFVQTLISTVRREYN